MPFLDNLQACATERPDEAAVVVGGRGVSWGALHAAAEKHVPIAPMTSVVMGVNSVEFVTLCGRRGRRAAVCSAGSRLEPGFEEHDL